MIQSCNVNFYSSVCLGTVLLSEALLENTIEVTCGMNGCITDGRLIQTITYRHTVHMIVLQGKGYRTKHMCR